MGELGPRQEAAIEALYRAFAQRPRPTHLRGPDYKEPQANLAKLTSKPLRELTGADLGFYTRCAPWTLGTFEDLCHFLPRILELSLRDLPDFVVDEQSLASKVLIREREAGKALLTDLERAALEEAFLAGWEWEAGQPERSYRAEGWFEGLLLLGVLDQRVVDAWLAAALPAALETWEYMVVGYAQALRRDGEVSGAYLDEAGSEARRQAARLLFDPRIAERVRLHLGESSSTRPTDWHLQDSLDLLETMCVGDIRADRTTPKLN